MYDSTSIYRSQLTIPISKLTQNLPKKTQFVMFTNRTVRETRKKLSPHELKYISAGRRGKPKHEKQPQKYRRQSLAHVPEARSKFKLSYRHLTGRTVMDTQTKCLLLDLRALPFFLIYMYILDH